jgi:hypothetical protein
LKKDRSLAHIALLKSREALGETHERPSTYILIRLIPQGSPPVSTGTWIPQPHFSAALIRVKPNQQKSPSNFSFRSTHESLRPAHHHRTIAKPHNSHTSKIRMECGDSPLPLRLHPPRPTSTARSAPISESPRTHAHQNPACNPHSLSLYLTHTSQSGVVPNSLN